MTVTSNSTESPQGSIWQYELISEESLGYWVTMLLVVGHSFGPALVFVVGCYEIYMSFASADWPARSARITKVEVDDDGEGGWSAKVGGTFVDDGVPFYSERMNYGAGPNLSIPVNQFRGEVVVDRVRDVYVSPSDPTHVVIFRPVTSWLYVALIPFMFVWSALGFMVLGAMLGIIPTHKTPDSETAEVSGPSPAS